MPPIPPQIYYLIFLVALTLVSFFSAKFTHTTNQIGKEIDKDIALQTTEQTNEQQSKIIKNSIKVFFTGLGFNLIWTFCCIYSKNIMFDAVVYDMLQTICYTASLTIVGAAATMTTLNFFGLFVVVIGLILMKL